jgi:hypothetical protein
MGVIFSCMADLCNTLAGAIQSCFAAIGNCFSGIVNAIRSCVAGALKTCGSCLPC